MPRAEREWISTFFCSVHLLYSYKPGNGAIQCGLGLSSSVNAIKTPPPPRRQSVTHRLTWSRQSLLVSLFIVVLDCFTLTDIVFFHVELTQWRENNSIRHMDTHTQACTWLHTHIHTCNQICTSYRKEIKRNEEEQRESHTLRNNPWMRHWPAKLPREREEISQTYWAAYKDVQRASGVKLSWMSPVLGWVFW